MLIKIYFLLTLLPFCSTKDTVPTFLIDYNQVLDHLLIEHNPFARTSVSKFADVVEDAVTHSSVLIIFVEHQLCTEDISIKDKLGTPFHYLRKELTTYKVKYLANVVNPVKLLTRVLEPTETNVFVLQTDQIFKPPDNMRFFYVFFKEDEFGTRAEVLRRHDEIMQHVYEKTREVTIGAVVAFYTGKVNPVIISKYDYGSTNVFGGGDPNDITMASHGAMLRFKGLTIDEGLSAKRRSADLEEPPKILRSEEKGNATTTHVAAGKYYMEFSFNFAVERWTLETIKVFEDDVAVGTKYMDVRVPYGRSYYCDEPLLFYSSKDQSAIIIPEYQIQPIRDEKILRAENEPEYMREEPTITDLFELAETKNGTVLENVTVPAKTKNKIPVEHYFTSGRRVAKSSPGNATLEFDEPIRCTNYFNIGILTGLSVSALFLVVLIIAVFCLYHIESNDRFEDPHGKQFYTTAIE